MSELPTIFALSSGPGRAAVAIVRVSGPRAGLVIDAMAGRRPAPRRATLRTLTHPVTAEPLDRGLVLWLPGPLSATGEDLAEFHIHGGPAVTRAVLSAIGTIYGCRLAEPGEYARRAFLNGRLDLAEVEGLADLIAAETEGQRRQAIRQASGVASALYEGWRSELIQAQSLTEAAIDFSDETDVSADALARARRIAEILAGAIAAHLDDGHRGEIIREGFRVTLAGAPNAGKSSLLNALVRREAAIVSQEAGTTRDVIEVHLDLGGYAVILADTAGLREAQGAVEAEGIRRTLSTARAADLVLWIVDGCDPHWCLPPELAGPPAVIVRSKIDIAPAAVGQHVPGNIVSVSAKTGAGLADLVARLGEEIGQRLEDADGGIVVAQARHRLALEGALEALERFLAGPIKDAELGAEDLRLAVSALGRITGRVDVEDVLSAIFARFCIGK